MQAYVHWLKINGMAPATDEALQYREIQNYLKEYPDAKATMYLYDYQLFHRVVKLECHQNWNDLDLNANCGSHVLTRLSQKPGNIGNAQPFKIPERLDNVPRRMTSAIEKLNHFKEKLQEKTFSVEITETLQRTIEIDAKDADEAESLVRAAYRNGDYILDADHFMGAEFSVSEKAPERTPASKSREPGL
jgi:hypothetical protein